MPKDSISLHRKLRGKIFVSTIDEVTDITTKEKIEKNI